MNAYNPLDSMRRLEAAGLERRQAEAIANEINEGKSDLVTREDLKQQLDAIADKLLIKVGIMVAAIVAMACSIMGVLISVK
ncbi:hypothetical protein [Sphingomonas sp.]|jgi:hypothetical protein|uniref:hypothetical protein n=1 Tax=Sphingomonas sp. TaxID=28214 RepID=UPI002EDA6463